jgi:hypothetical protein
MMASRYWGEDVDPNEELWEDFFYVIAQWLCQLRALMETEPADNHIENPAVHNDTCGSCYDKARRLTDDGLLKLLQVYGSVAYACGKTGVPEDRAARHALHAMVERSHDIERAKVLLARKRCN